MNRIAKFVVENSRTVFVCILAVSIALALLAGRVASNGRNVERMTLLTLEAERRSIEIMSQTMSGKLIGSASMLGLLDPDLKREALGELLPGSVGVNRLLGVMAHYPDVDGAFVVGRDGIIKSSVGAGKSSTGADVKFRPYFEMALKGRESVYAAIGTTTGRRTLYFAAPLHQGDTPESPSVGAVVARASMEPIDRMLSGKSDMALLLSPQGVVFAANRPEWIGFLAGRSTPERLQAIRDLKQFGAMFASSEPHLLPISVDAGMQKYNGRRYAVVSALVKWNDPHGDWKLILMEDLSRTVPVVHAQTTVVTAVLALLIGLLSYLFLRSHYAQFRAARQGQEYAAALEKGGKDRDRLAHLSRCLQQASGTAELGQIFLTESHRLLGMLQGVIYAVSDGPGESLRLLAQYACAESPPADELVPGNGLLGQCVLDQRMQVFDTESGKLFAIRSGLGETVPAAVIMAPVLLNSRVLGVVEIALLTVPEQSECELFEEMAKLLAINLDIIGRTERTEAALASTCGVRPPVDSKHEPLELERAGKESMP